MTLQERTLWIRSNRRHKWIRSFVPRSATIYRVRSSQSVVVLHRHIYVFLFDWSRILLTRRLYSRDITMMASEELCTHVATKFSWPLKVNSLSLSPPRGHMYLAMTLYWYTFPFIFSGLMYQFIWCHMVSTFGWRYPRPGPRPLGRSVIHQCTGCSHQSRPWLPREIMYDHEARIQSDLCWVGEFHWIYCCGVSISGNSILCMWQWQDTSYQDIQIPYVQSLSVDVSHVMLHEYIVAKTRLCKI